MLSGRKKMKLLRFLPGCLRIQDESIRRVYVWLMVPWLGMILLGVESGLNVSVSIHTFGSYLTGVIALLPHGIVEIPTIACAGAVPFAAHLAVKEQSLEQRVDEIFEYLDSFINQVPLKRIISLIACCLLIAGAIEAHITSRIVDTLLV